MARTKKQYSQAKGKKPINNRGKKCDIRDEYDAFFPIFLKMKVSDSVHW